MENGSFKDNSRNIPSEGRKNELESGSEKKFSRKAVKKSMTEQLIAPPVRVWEKIERILDQQDERRNQANEILSATLGFKEKAKRKSIYWAAAGVTVVAGVLIIIL